MCFCHSIVIKIEKDNLLEVHVLHVCLNQIINIFSWDNVSKTPLSQSLCKNGYSDYLDVRGTDVLLIACKIREIRPIDLKLTCSTNFTNLF